MTVQMPPEAVKAAEDIAKAELADYGDVRQIAGHVARLVLEAAAPFLTTAEVRARLAGQAAVHDDLSDLLEALGMGTHARPQSPHEVMQECIARARWLRERLEAS